MRNTSTLNRLAAAGALALGAVALGLWLYARDVESSQRAADARMEPESRVVSVMQKMEVRSEKLYYTARDQEWTQAALALTELSEAAATLYGRDIHYEEANISAVAESLLPEQFGRLRQTIERRDRDAFTAEYKLMIDACNSCHRATRQLAVAQEPPPRRRFY